MQNVSRQAEMLYLILDTDKELTNSLLLASDWLTISVCVILFDKESFMEKSHNMTSKIPLLLQILGCNPISMIVYEIPCIAQLINK